YSTFVELGCSLIANSGRTGMVIPSGIATDEPNKHLMQHLFSEGNIVSLFDFENKGIFPSVHSSFKFCLLTITGARDVGGGNAAFAFFLHSVEELSENGRRFVLSSDDIALLNPNTRTCPVFRGARDAETTKSIYRRVPSFQVEGKADGDPWGLQ